MSHSDVRTVIMRDVPCPVCGDRASYEAAADFIGDAEERWWGCGRQEIRRVGGEWREVSPCGKGEEER